MHFTFPHLWVSDENQMRQPSKPDQEINTSNGSNESTDNNSNSHSNGVNVRFGNSQGTKTQNLLINRFNLSIEFEVLIYTNQKIHIFSAENRQTCTNNKESRPMWPRLLIWISFQL